MDGTLKCSSLLLRKHSLIGLHVNCAAADDIKEQDGPLSGLLGAALHCVKHATHLGRRGINVTTRLKVNVIYKKGRKLILDSFLRDDEGVLTRFSRSFRASCIICFALQSSWYWSSLQLVTICCNWLYREVRRPSLCSSCPFRQVSTNDKNGCWLSRDILGGWGTLWSDGWQIRPFALTVSACTIAH